MVGWTEIGEREEQIEAGAGKSTGLSSAEFYLFIFLIYFTCIICNRISKMDASLCLLPLLSGTRYNVTQRMFSPSCR